MSYYRVKIAFISDELQKNGKPKATNEYWLLQAESTEEANIKVHKHIAETGTVLETEILEVSKQKIEKVILD